MPDPQHFSGLATINEPGEPGGASSVEVQGPMDDSQFQAAVKSEIDDAIDYIDGFIAPDRAQATQYYRGDPFGNEEEGRSQIVMTEVRDVVQAMLPPLLRIFAQGDRVVEFAPRSAEKVAMAEQSTDYVNLVFFGDNPGFAILHNTFKDALTRKSGVIKWRWAKERIVTEASFTKLTQGQLAILQADSTVTFLDVSPQEADPMTGEPTFNARIRRSVPRNRAVVEAIPPEEFICARETRDIETSPFVGHRCYKTVSDLVAMGYDRDEVEEHIGGGDVFALNTEAQTRNPAVMSFMQQQDSPDASMRQALYIEAWQRIDKDGDGIAELRRICTIGQGAHILFDEVATDAPFAFFCPDPEPHMLIGQSVADQVKDLQLIKSNIVRNTLDSLAHAVLPRTGVVEGQANIDDVLNTETGGIIRMRSPGAVIPFTMPFVGAAAMPLLAWFDQIRARRTGVSDASQGLDPDVLQSTTQDAVTATVSGAQERIELVARIFAETGMKRLFKGLLRLIVENQDAPRIVRMRGQFVTVDPRTWDSDLDVQINVALGRGTDQDKMKFLMLVAQKQEQLLQLLGPINALCDLQQLGNTYQQICNLAGFKDASRYFKNVDPQQMQAMASQPPKPDPNMALVQIEAQKVQADTANKQQRIQLDAQEALARITLDGKIAELKAQNDREATRLNIMARLAEIEAKYNTQLQTTGIEAAISRDQAIADNARQGATDVHATETQAAVDRHATETQALTDRHNAIVQAAAQPQAVSE